MVEWHFISDIVADAFYDSAAGTWVLTEAWWPTSLDIADPNAADGSPALPVSFTLEICRESTMMPVRKDGSTGSNEEEIISKLLSIAADLERMRQNPLDPEPHHLRL